MMRFNYFPSEYFKPKRLVYIVNPFGPAEGGKGKPSASPGSPLTPEQRARFDEAERKALAEFRERKYQLEGDMEKTLTTRIQSNLEGISSFTGTLEEAEYNPGTSDWQKWNQRFTETVPGMVDDPEKAQQQIRGMQRVLFASLGVLGDPSAEPDGKIGPYTLAAMAVRAGRKEVRVPHPERNTLLAALAKALGEAETAAVPEVPAAQELGMITPSEENPYGKPEPWGSYQPKALAAYYAAAPGYEPADGPQLPIGWLEQYNERQAAREEQIDEELFKRREAAMKRLEEARQRMADAGQTTAENYTPVQAAEEELAAIEAEIGEASAVAPKLPDESGTEFAEETSGQERVSEPVEVAEAPAYTPPNDHEAAVQRWQTAKRKLEEAQAALASSGVSIMDENYDEQYEIAVQNAQAELDAAQAEITRIEAGANSDSEGPDMTPRV